MYYLIYGSLYLFSLLPLRVLYLFSDFACFMLYRVVGYRKAVVMSNLDIAFPEKTTAEKKEIARKFYRLFTDTFIEAIKLISMTPEAVERRVEVDDSVARQIRDSGKNAQVHAMHNFNWEVVNVGMARRLYLPLLAVYMPIKNKYFEKIFNKIRTKTGTVFIRATNFKNEFHEHLNKRFILALVADQSPGKPEQSYWVNFFGRLTPFVTGPEKGARLNNTAVVFTNFYRIRRGYYRIEWHVETFEPRSLPEGELTLRFVRYTEDCIQKRPENYLWSHRRWKRPYKEEYEHLVIRDKNEPLKKSV